MRRHLKRLGIPKSWPVKRKGITFTAKPRPGTHKQKECITVIALLRDVLKIGRNLSEVKKILNTNSFLVDGKIRKDHRFTLGLMDIITLTDKNYRLIINQKGKFALLSVSKEEAKEKISKITDKKILKKGKVQINFYDSKNLLVDKDNYKVGDSVIISANKIKKHLKFEKGAVIYITGGKHIGEIGKLEEIEQHKGVTKDTIIISSGKNKIKTSKEYAFIIENESNARIKD